MATETTGQTWRVVLADGDVREVVPVPRDLPTGEPGWTVDGETVAATQRGAVLKCCGRSPLETAEIVPPGEMTRAEAVRAAVLAEKEACAAACRDIASDMAKVDCCAETADACAEAIEARVPYAASEVA